jgi:hypothetical protein
MQKTWETLRSYIPRWLSLRNTSENISPERAIDAFRDGLIRRDFKEELGRCKAKTIDHLISLANEWADGEDSIANPRSRRRSPDHNVDPKDQLDSGSRRVQQIGRRGRYGDLDTTDMVAAGYINNNHDDNRDGPRQGNTYYGSSSRGTGRDSRPKTEWHWSTPDRQSLEDARHCGARRLWSRHISDALKRRMHLRQETPYLLTDVLCGFDAGIQAIRLRRCLPGT